MIPFVRQFDFEYGRCDAVSPLIRRVVADNPGPFTFTGTGTYIVGEAGPGATVAVIDPGPDDAAHLAALRKAVAGQTVSHVLITHAHLDHAGLARAFAGAVGAPVLAATPPAHTIHASAPDEEDVRDFAPDIVLSHGDRVTGPGWTLETLATPGHTSSHLCFALVEENALFTGDHIMGWSTTVVAPPDGDMAQYMTSLQAVAERDFAILWPTHGPPIIDPAPFLTAYRDHRLGRDAQILTRLAAGDRTIAQMVPTLYAAIEPRLWPAASLSVWAHLIALAARGLVTVTPGPLMDADWRRA